MTEPPLIQGKIARVMAPYDVVINKGSRDGVTYGKIFRVLSAAVEAVNDPDDPEGEPLGYVRRTRFFVKAVDVSERMTVATTYREFRTEVSKGPSFRITLQAFEPPPEYEWKRESFRARGNDDPPTRGVGVGDVIEEAPPGSDDDDAATLIIVE